MKKWCLTLTMLGFVFSCTKKENTENLGVIADISQSTQPAKKTLQLETFGFPSDIEGCSCYFAANKDDFEKEKYLFADDFSKQTYIKVNGELLKLKTTDDNMDPENFTKNIDDEKFKINITGKRIAEEQELFFFDGKMTITDKINGLVTTTPIYGECGC